MTGRGSTSHSNTSKYVSMWYLGSEVTREAATTLLNASISANCFGVYKSSDLKYTFCSKYKLENVRSYQVDHLVIDKSTSGGFKLPGQERTYEDIVEAVETFAASFQPPLLPALEGSSFETHISIEDNPPDYGTENGALKNDLPPLTDITGIRIGSSSKDKAENEAPLLSNLEKDVQYFVEDSHDRPMWHHYKHLRKCHPKNVCYGCCYRERRYNGYGYEPSYLFLDCRGSGPLRVLGLVILWLLFGPCIGLGLLIFLIWFCRNAHF